MNYLFLLFALIQFSRATQIGIIPVDNGNVGEIYLGTPGQVQKVIFDTGSYVAWVASKSCSTCYAFTTFYDQTKSSTFKNIGQSFNEFDATAGTTFSDTLTIGGITIPNQVVAQATVLNNTLGWENNLGIFGMSILPYSWWNTYSTTTNLFYAGLVPQNVFSVWHTPNAFQQNNGIIFLGGTNTSYYTGPIYYTGLHDNGSWCFNIKSASLGGKKLSSFKQQVCIDTGGLFSAGGPGLQTSKIIKMIGASNSSSDAPWIFNIDCNRINTLPNLTFEFGSFTLTIPPSIYITYDGCSNTCTLNIGDGGNGGDPNDGDTWVFSRTFFYQYYTIFDYAKLRVGFALSNKNAPTANNFISNSIYNVWQDAANSAHTFKRFDNQTWIETNNGSQCFSFTFVSQSSSSVILLDTSRDLYIELKCGQCLIGYNDISYFANNWILYNGTWINKAGKNLC